MTSPAATSITLEQYAGIIVAVGEGHALDAVLAQEEVAADAWDALDTDFKDRLSQESELFSAYVEHVIEAEDTLARTVAPLAEDPVAYLAFVSAFAASEPGPLLEAHALNLADIGRLGRQWERRFAADEELRTKAFESAQEATPPTAIQVEVAELRPYRWTGGGSPTNEELAAQPEADDPLGHTLDPSQLPSAYRPSARAAGPPPAFASPPKAAPIHVPPPHRLEPSPALGRTAPVGRAPSSAATPFRGKARAPAPSSLEPHPNLGATAPLGAKTPHNPASQLEPVAAMGGTAPLRNRPTGPATPFSGQQPAPRRASLEPHPNLGQTAPVAEPETQQPAPGSQSKGRLEPVAHLGETASIDDVAATELPFAGSNAAPPRTRLEPHPELGGTAPLEPSKKRRASLEPNPALSGTVVMPPRKRRSLEPNLSLGKTVAMPPTQAPPTQAPPTQAPPTQAPPTQAPPTDDDS